MVPLMKNLQLKFSMTLQKQPRNFYSLKPSRKPHVQFRTDQEPSAEPVVRFIIISGPNSLSPPASALIISASGVNLFKVADSIFCRAYPDYENAYARLLDGIRSAKGDPVVG
ncbi:MAG: hypothetical protein R3F37_04705 [Candidatus Competibacteraceae bacterium]